MTAIILSILFPGVIFVASMFRLFGCLKRRTDGVYEYVWATGYSLVSCMSAMWLAADIASLYTGTFATQRAPLIMSAGLSLFVALGFLLVLRPILRVARIVTAAVAKKVKQGFAYIGKIVLEIFSRKRK